MVTSDVKDPYTQKYWLFFSLWSVCIHHVVENLPGCSSLLVLRLPYQEICPSTCFRFNYPLWLRPIFYPSQHPFLVHKNTKTGILSVFSTHFEQFFHFFCKINTAPQGIWLGHLDGSFFLWHNNGSKNISFLMPPNHGSVIKIIYL